jgi:hypothetical protein
MLDVLPLLSFGAMSLLAATCLVAWPRAGASLDVPAETTPAKPVRQPMRDSDGMVGLAIGTVVTAVIVIALVMLANGRVASTVPLLGLIASIASGLLYVHQRGTRSMSSRDDSSGNQVGKDDTVTEQ